MKRVFLVGFFVVGAVFVSSNAQAQYGCYRCQTPNGGCVQPLYQGWVVSDGIGENCCESESECYPNQWCCTGDYKDIQRPGKTAPAFRLATKRPRQRQHRGASSQS